MTEQALDNLLRQVMLDATYQEYGDLIEQQPEHDFSPAFEKKMQKLIQRADHPVRYRCLRTLRIAVALAALLTLLTVATAAAGYDIWRMLAEWTAEKITLLPGQIEYADSDDIHIPEEPGEYTDIQEALTAYGINHPVVPQWMPEGFVLEELIIDDDNFRGEINFVTLYSNGENTIIFQVNVYLEHENGRKEDFSHIYKDEGDPIPYVVGDVTHLLTTNAGRSVALWANGPMECFINGDITIEELKQMIDSIYE